VRPGELVLDVGAGMGAVTAALLAAGARVIAIELHQGRAAWLRQRFAAHDVTVVETDAADLLLPRRPFRVVANPPYAITSPLLRRLLQPRSRLVAAHIVLQRQAARRWASAAAPGYRRWSKMFEARLGRGIPRSAFRPYARVDHTVLVIRRRGRAPKKRHPLPPRRLVGRDRHVGPDRPKARGVTDIASGRPQGGRSVCERRRRRRRGPRSGWHEAAERTTPWPDRAPLRQLPARRPARRRAAEHGPGQRETEDR